MRSHAALHHSDARGPESFPDRRSTARRESSRSTTSSRRWTSISPGCRGTCASWRTRGFVRVRPDGPRRLYSLRPEPLRELNAWVSQYRALWEGRLDAFAVGARTQTAGAAAPTPNSEEAEEGLISTPRAPQAHHAREGLPSGRPGCLGPVDDQRRHRVVVGPRRIRRDGPQARPASRVVNCCTR